MGAARTRSLVVHLNITQVQHVVWTLNNSDSIRHAPAKWLLVQWNVTDLVCMDLEGFIDHRLTLCLIRFTLDHVRQLGHAFVAVSTQIECAHTIFSTGNQTGENVVAVKG